MAGSTKSLDSKITTTLVVQDEAALPATDLVRDEYTFDTRMQVHAYRTAMFHWLLLRPIPELVAMEPFPRVRPAGTEMELFNIIDRMYVAEGLYAS